MVQVKCYGCHVVEDLGYIGIRYNRNNVACIVATCFGLYYVCGHNKEQVRTLSGHSTFQPKNICPRSCLRGILPDHQLLLIPYNLTHHRFLLDSKVDWEPLSLPLHHKRSLPTGYGLSHQGTSRLKTPRLKAFSARALHGHHFSRL